ncbi:hypothetical protein Tco_0699308 [Tanacetum coccineum]
MDFYELKITGDLLSIGWVSGCLELSVGEEDLLTLKVLALKNSSYKGPNRRSNSCCDGAVVSAKGEIFCSWGAGSELSSDAFCHWRTRPEVIINRCLYHLFDFIKLNMYGFNYQSASLVVNSISLRLSGHAVAITSTQKNKGSLEAESIVRAASTRVRFRLLTMPFCSVVRGVDV